jgi:cell division protein FtsQ
MAKSRIGKGSVLEDDNPLFLDEEVAEPRPPKRSRKAPVAEEKSPRRRLLLWLIVAFFLVVFVAAIALFYQVDTFLATDDRFTLASVGLTSEGTIDPGAPLQVTGVEYTPMKDVLEVFRQDAGRSLYLLPLAQRRRELQAIDWVEDASVTRLWPNQLRVTIRERSPVVMAALAGQRAGEGYRMMLADRAGHLMRLPPRAKFDLPIVFGLSLGQDIEFRSNRIDLLERMQEEVQPLNARFSELDISDPKNLRATLVLEGRTVVLLLGNESYLNRVKTFLVNYETLVRAKPEANLFDMRLDDRIVATREGLSGA